jgi:pilus assembly protein Flp/PilA
MLLARKEKGQGLVEYALIIVLVSIVVVAALTILGPRISNLFNTIGGTLGAI